MLPPPRPPTHTQTHINQPLYMDVVMLVCYPLRAPCIPQHALAACESYAGEGACKLASCGNFYYYYKATDKSCDMAKTGYEWIYKNTGYTSVGQDYGQGSASVNGNSMFVRYRSGNNWALVLSDLGAVLSSDDDNDGGSGSGQENDDGIKHVNALRIVHIQVAHCTLTCSSTRTAGAYGTLTCPLFPCMHNTQIR